MLAHAVDEAPPGTSLQCEGCGAQINVAAGLRTAKCPYCASPAVVARPADPSRPEPSFVVGFVVTEEAARATARKWLRRAWLAPSAFRRADLADVRGTYLPAYLYTAEAHARYQASIGENYTVVETYTTTDSKGNTVTRTRTRTKTEWRELSGEWSAFVDDAIVTSSRGLPNDELQAIEPFDLRALMRFTPAVLAGWIAEDPSLSPAACMQQARAEAADSIAARLAAHMPGDSHRELRFTHTLKNEDLELLMLPVWVLAVRYAADRPPVRLVLNGQTGSIHGRAPKSWAKIGGIVLAVLGLVAAWFLLGGVR
jgi:hypothetical protein